MSVQKPHGSLKAYITGFVFSVVATIEAYLLVQNHVATGWVIIIGLLGMATAQLLIQLIFFLNLDVEQKPRWNGFAFLFMLMVVGILVGGTIWIMHNLDYNHTHTSNPYNDNSFIIKDEGVHQ